MHHHVFALFADPQAANAAATEVRELGSPDHKLSIIAHKDAFRESDVRFTETHVWHGASLGALYGGGAGALLGALLAGPFGFIGVGWLAAAAFGAASGGILAGLAGALGGVGDPDHDLERLAEGLDQGKVLLNVTALDAAEGEQVGEILARHGGEVIHGRGVTPDL